MRWLWLTLVLLLLSEVAAADPLVKRGDRVWLIGDSNGWLLMHELPKLAEKDGVTLEGNPVGGASLFWWTDPEHRRYLWQMNGFHPDVVVVVLGTNDAHFPPHVRASLPARMLKLQLAAARGGRTVVWVGPPKLREPIEPGAEAFRLMVMDTGSPLLDSRQCAFPMLHDGIHPTIPGRKTWAEWIWKELTTVDNVGVTGYSEDTRWVAPS